MANRFKKIQENKKAGSKSAAQVADVKMKARTCPQCGAPRPAGASVKICAYCEFDFMSMN